MKPDRDFLPSDTAYPYKGLNVLDPSTQSDPRYSPRAKNVTVTKGIVSKRPGYVVLGDGLPVDDIVLESLELESFSGTKKFTAITVRNRFLFDSTAEEWKIMGKILDECEDYTDWNDDDPIANITLSDEGTIKKYGTNSLKIAVAAGFGTGKIAFTDDFSSTDLTKYNSVSCWVRSDVALAEDDLSIVLCEDTDGAKTNDYVTLNLEAVATVDTWTLVRASAVGDFSALGAVITIGIYLNTDNGAQNIYIDDIRCTYEWSGTDETYPIDYTIGSDDSGKYLFLSNGKDWPLWWEGSWADFRQIPLDITAFVQCKSVEIYYNRLFLGNVEVASEYRQSVYWSEPGDFTDFEATASGSGKALITDSKGDIERLLPLGDFLIIYSEDSIGRASYVGGDVLFSFEQMVSGTRLVSPRTVVNVGPYHFYMSLENFYVFDGSNLVQPIGDMIHRDFRDELDHDNKPKAFGFHDIVTKEVYWGVPVESIDGSTSTEYASTRIYLLEYDLYDIKNLRWTSFTYGHQATCYGYYARHESLAWNSSSISGHVWKNPEGGTDTEIQGAWNSSSSRAETPVKVIGSSGEVYFYDGNASTDGGEAIESFWDSIDFVVPQAYLSAFARWIEVEVELKGSQVDVQYSTDLGVNFTDVDTIILDSSWTRYKLFFDKTAKNIRIRLKTSYGNFSLRWLRVWFVPGAPR